MIYIADAAAVKVCSPDVYLIEYLRTFLRRRSQHIVTDFLNHYFDEVLTFFGPNIIASIGEESKKYRKITAPAFSEVCHEPYLLLNPE